MVIAMTSKHNLLALLFALFANVVMAAPTLPHTVEINGVEFVLVPAGEFWYGVQNGSRQSAIDNRRPMFRDVRIWLDSFYIAKYEARASDFKRFMDSADALHRNQYAQGESDGCAVRRGQDGAYLLVDAERDLPVTHLSWQLADEFTRWMGFRLPTEIEWVKAARGTDHRLWPWGNQYPDDTFAVYASDGACNPQPVTARSNGKSPYGAFNMAGNVLEYVADWYNEEYDLTLRDGQRNPPLATQGSKVEELPHPMKILKGGRWASNASAISIYSRSLKEADRGFLCFGTRFAIDAASVLEHLKNGSATILAE